MGKEVKIGLAVIAALLCVFGGVLAMRLKREQPATALEKVADAEKDGKIKSTKKKVEKPGKEGKEPGGPSLGAGLNNLSERSRRARPEATGKTDRYGRPLSDDDSTLQADGEPQTDLADVNQMEAPDVRTSAYNKPNSADRYGRYAARDDATVDEGGESSEVPGDERADDDVAMPADRFAQPTGGLSFSEVDEADDADTDDENDNQDGAPRFSMEQSTDRFDSDSDVAERDLNVAEQPGEDDAEVRLAPVPDDERELRPAANDRFRTRTNDERPLAGRSLPVAEDMAGDADALPEETVEARPHRLRQLDGDSYTVEPNDNFWRISQKVYGTGAYFKALEAHNRQQFGDRPLINVGDVVSVPPLSELQQKYPDLSPRPRNVPDEPRRTALASSPARGGRTYTVAEGDTLFDIARQELGKASRWAEIYELNREQLGEDFNYLSPGMQLALPARGDRSDPIATRPSRDTYRR